MSKQKPPWQRLVLSIIGVTIVALMWRWSVFHLYSLPEHTIVSFTSLTNNAFYVIGAVVIFMISGKLIYDWKNQTTSNLIDQASHISEKIDKKESIHIKEERFIHENVKYEGDSNAPETKPFGQKANEE